MQQNQKEYLMVFTSNSRATYIYDRLLQKGCKVKLVSTPCKISAGCTQAIRFNEADAEIVNAETQKNNVIPTGVYQIIKLDQKVEYVSV